MHPMKVGSIKSKFDPKNFNTKSEQEEYGFGQLFEAFENKDPDTYFKNLAWLIQQIGSIGLGGLLSPVKCNYTGVFQKDATGLYAGWRPDGWNPSYDPDRMVTEGSCHYTFFAGLKYSGKETTCKGVHPVLISNACEKTCEKLGNEYKMEASGCDGNTVWCWCNNK